MARAIEENREHRASGSLGEHVLEVMESILTSGHSDRRIAISTTVAPIPLVPLSEHI